MRINSHTFSRAPHSCKSRNWSYLWRLIVNFLKSLVLYILILFLRARKLIVNFCSSLAGLKSRRNLCICCVTFGTSCPSFSGSQEYAISKTHSASKHEEKEVWDSGMNKVYDERGQYFRYLLISTSFNWFSKINVTNFNSWEWILIIFVRAIVLAKNKNKINKKLTSLVRFFVNFLKSIELYILIDIWKTVFRPGLKILITRAVSYQFFPISYKFCCAL